MTSKETEKDQIDNNDVVHRTLSVQKNSLVALQDSQTINEITKVANVIDEEDGRVIFTGIGKSGDVGKKISSTFNSIGISSHTIHPVEALHGDLGALSDNDIIVLISNSGNTDEMVELLQFLDSFVATTVAITSDPDSKLGQQTDYHINTRVKDEGAIVDLVPMASATATMVIGDCIANALMASRDFGEQEYGHFHPGGTIGKRLLLTVGDLMYEEIPEAHPSDTLAQIAIKISEGGKGIAVVQNDKNHVQGILTDGDLRRLIESGADLRDTTAEDVMTTDPVTTSPEALAIRALDTIEDYSITQLVVTDVDDKFLGVIHIHDIMMEGLSQ
ncbi:KpsF/GutQ family sugar-phosphate isomerase [Halosegnis longus]|uniref:KpsF/GutQ family sugar-phosphate isomerase n=1 Tax=Halosegnis longus TaxID=2216012 RepID=UPI0009AD6EDA|nr:KpsF/GutQ family sugar-phosphate isomerase [Salella cibi]